MQRIFFAIGHVTEKCLLLLIGMGWLPVILISITLFVGLIYWLNLQGKYDKKAQQDNTLA